MLLFFLAKRIRLAKLLIQAHGEISEIPYTFEVVVEPDQGRWRAYCRALLQYGRDVGLPRPEVFCPSRQKRSSAIVH